MNVVAAGNDRTVLVLGAPRSGTTWLGKLLDSSPCVLYRHEPDMLIDPQPPRVVAHEPDVAECALGAACLDAMIAGRFFKSSGKLPMFRKAYRSALGQAAHGALIMGLHLGQKFGNTRRMRGMLAPDMVSARKLATVTVVMKSISSLGRVNLFARARPGIRLILILRDPFGQIASMLRGITQGKFERDVVLYECLETAQAARHGITRASFEALSRVEQHAWYWALMNDKAIEDLQGNPNAMVVCYNDLVREPDVMSRSIFAFCGLPVERQTVAFLHASTAPVQSSGYYQVFRSSTDALEKWRGELPVGDQARIRDIVSRSLAWQQHPGLRAS